MRKQVHPFITEKESEVLGLKKLLFDLAPEVGLELTIEGLFKSPVRQLHTEDFWIFWNKQIVGKYSFEFVKNHYEGTLDLENVPQEIYKNLMLFVASKYDSLF